MGAGFGVTALGTGIAAEGMIAPSGIPVTFQLLTTAITLGIIAVHIAVLIGIHRFCTAVLAIPTSSTLTI